MSRQQSRSPPRRPSPTAAGSTGAGSYVRPKTRQRAYKPPPPLVVPNIEDDPAERKRILNVLAQRRYRERNRIKKRLRASQERGEDQGQDQDQEYSLGGSPDECLFVLGSTSLSTSAPSSAATSAASQHAALSPLLGGELPPPMMASPLLDPLVGGGLPDAASAWSPQPLDEAAMQSFLLGETAAPPGFLIVDGLELDGVVNVDAAALVGGEGGREEEEEPDSTSDAEGGLTVPTVEAEVDPLLRRIRHSSTSASPRHGDKVSSTTFIDEASIGNNTRNNASHNNSRTRSTHSSNIKATTATNTSTSLTSTQGTPVLKPGLGSSGTSSSLGAMDMSRSTSSSSSLSFGASTISTTGSRTPGPSATPYLRTSPRRIGVAAAAGSPSTGPAAACVPYDALTAWSLECNSPFNTETPASPELLPLAWRPPTSQVDAARYLTVDCMPWTGTRDKLSSGLPLSQETRPEGTSDDGMGLFDFAYDFEDDVEAMRIYGADPYDCKSWEVAQAGSDKWWLSEFDRDVAERSSSWRRAKGATPSEVRMS